MIGLIDQYFVDRLQHIICDDNPITVYGHGASRPKGKTKYPSASVSRILGPYPDLKKARPHIEVFTPSEEEQTIVVPQYQPGAGEYTGPASWTWQPCPTPVEVAYQVDLEAKDKAHMDAMMLLIWDALPVPFHMEINGKSVPILPEGTPTNLDDLAKPLFRTAFRYTVMNVWIDRQIRRQSPSISDVEMEFDA